MEATQVTEREITSFYHIIVINGTVPENFDQTHFPQNFDFHPFALKSVRKNEGIRALTAKSHTLLQNNVSLCISN